MAASLLTSLYLVFVAVLVLPAVSGQSTFGKYDTAKYRHRCVPGGKQCQYTVTLPDCKTEEGGSECSSADNDDQAILANLVDLVSQQTTQIQQLSEAIHRLENKCSPPVTYKDCSDVANMAASTASGVYQIHPDGELNPFEVYCEISNTEAWTVIQRRLNGSVDFYRNWAEYKSGFGYIDHEYWLGNDKIHALTTQGSYKLRIDLEDWDNSASYAEYDRFWIGSETDLYTLHLGDYSGTAGDAMKNTMGQGTDLDGHAFSTYDQDNDALDDQDCARISGGAWWYNACQYSDLNGVYSPGGTPPTVYSGVRWSPGGTVNHSRKTVVMKIQRIR